MKQDNSCINPVVVCKCEYGSSLLCVYRIVGRSFALCAVVLSFSYQQTALTQATFHVLGRCLPVDN